MRPRAVLIAAVACAACLEWTRLAGTVKGVNLKTESVTIQNRDGDLLMVPVDYQVRIVDKRGEPVDLKHLELDQKVTLTRTPQERPKDEPLLP